MLALRLPEKTEKRLDHLVQITGHSKSFYAKKAIEEYLDDQEDYIIAMKRIEDNLPSIPLNEVERIINEMES